MAENGDVCLGSVGSGSDADKRLLLKELAITATASYDAVFKLYNPDGPPLPDFDRRFFKRPEMGCTNDEVNAAFTEVPEGESTT